MKASKTEVKKRETAAIAAIKRALASEDEESGVTLFISHHLEEVEAKYWKKHLGTTKPKPSSIIDILELRGHWGGDDELDTFDFTLPDDATNYVICVRFDEKGTVEEISMES
jgi:Protein of unknown function (DUF2004)